MASHFVDANLWTRRYQRNNKRTGLKNLRCFPMCSETHRVRGFCGRPVVFRVNRSNDSTRPIHVWGELIKSDENGSITVGSRIPFKLMLERERTKDKPFNPYIPGDPIVGDTLRTKASLTFEFNRQKRGWHYGWVANKHTCDSEHMMRTYVFEEVDAQTLLCLEGVNSPTFSIFCRRRQRDKVDDLPPQIREQLAVMAKEKKVKQEAKVKQDKRKKQTKSATGRKRSRKLESPESIDGSGDEVAMIQDYGKNMKVFSLDPLGEHEEHDSDVDMLQDVLTVGRKMIPFQIATVADNAKAIRKADKKRVNIDAKLFRVTHALLTFEGGSPAKKTATKESSLLKEEPENKMLEVSTAGDLFGMEGDNVSSQELGDYTKSIADCLENFFPEWNSGFDTIFSNEAELESLTGEDLVDEALDCKLTCNNVIKELAQFLVEEHSFTELISQVFTQDIEKCSPAIRRRVFFDLLEEHLGLFLKRFDMTLDELDDLLVHAMTTQYGSTDPNVIPFKNMGIENHISMYCATSPKSDKDPVMQFPSNNTIPRTVPLAAKAAERSALALGKDFSRKPPHPSHPNFTGVWERESSTLDKLEDIRETIGVPWVLRKIFKQIESRFEIWHTESHMNVQSNRKLMSSGFMSYKLDGKEHPWDLPPPVFTGRPVGVSYLAKVEGNAVKLIHNYSTRKRLVRHTRCIDGTHLESTLVYQDRESKSGPWRTIVETTLRAVRVDKQQVAHTPAPVLASHLPVAVK